jgi:hypothetical protein
MLLFGHLLAALSVSSILSAIAAFTLRPFYHGYFDQRGGNPSIGWVIYFDFEILRIDYRTMLAVFGLLFVLAPVAIGFWQSRHTPEPQFGRWYGIVIFGAVLIVGACLNLWIGITYAVAGFNSSDPF